MESLTWADVLSELQKLSDEEKQQTAIVYDDLQDEFRPLITGPTGKIITRTDNTCGVFDPGQAVLMI